MGEDWGNDFFDELHKAKKHDALYEKIKKESKAHGYKIRTIHELSDDKFSCRYKGHEISIEREENVNGYMNRFYIQVMDSSGEYAYDGYWRDQMGIEEMPEAITEALRGSWLLPDQNYDCPIHGLQDGPDCPRC